MRDIAPLLTLSLGILSQSAAAAPCPHLLFAYFESSEELHYALSDDGFHWNVLNHNYPVYNTTIQGTSIRDPYIHQGQNGLYYMVSTNGAGFGGTPTILTWSSPDLITWSKEFVADVMGPQFFPPPAKVDNTWAPEWVWDVDTQQYMVFWAARGTNLTKPDPPGACTGTQEYRFKFFRSWTKDFMNFSQPEVFFDPGCFYTGDGGIDGDIVLADNGTYMFYYKDARGVGEGHDVELIRGIRVVASASSSAAGPYLNASISQLLVPTLVEGPEAVAFNGGWLLYFDCSFWPTPSGYPRPPYGVATIPSLSDPTYTFVPGSCNANSTDVSFPPAATHGAFICVSDAQEAALKKAFP